MKKTLVLLFIPLLFLSGCRIGRNQGNQQPKETADQSHIINHYTVGYKNIILRAPGLNNVEKYDIKIVPADSASIELDGQEKIISEVFAIQHNHMESQDFEGSKTADNKYKMVAKETLTDWRSPFQIEVNLDLSGVPAEYRTADYIYLKRALPTRPLETIYEGRESVKGDLNSNVFDCFLYRLISGNVMAVVYRQPSE